ncbi:Alkyl sulfatase BDS1, metallo-beta-lactamase superfamily [Nocardioides sp. YR527]|uniref:alkyl/aryl-sulfatase n=1 Tax=Nocardioides sp. YR527 TaxID=1881028 RepID=UPI00088DCECC|nr:alkyl sulfatase dimerization domain-containing protein [Nocardioides sp. YR527]SDK72776.1 Alkyl sulfatase BDS1, metallo-beta-lactamase superfamily [Nocardioides sp. YR527]
MTSTPRPATRHVVARNEAVLRELPFDDHGDFADADRGLIKALDDCVIRAEDGRVVWDNEAYRFLDGDAPGTVNPSLWRQSQLVTRQGLYEVIEGIYQVRGFDISNVTFVEGERGVIVIDPLLSVETAAAAIALYREHRGERPVTGVIYSHSHIDHFGGVKGVTTQEAVDAGEVPVIAPAGFLEHAVAENIYTGTAMARRAGYMYGAALERGPHGQVSAGLGSTTSTGMASLIVPTIEVATTGEELILDGVRIVFQMAPGAEAPSEFHFYFPDFRALFMAENANHTMHNLVTLRGALVRDPHVWARYLTETIEMFGDDLEVALAGHNWPMWGRERVVDFIATQRDLYAYLHDQTVRLINRGMVGSEIAETFRLPPALEKAWHARGYYGSVSHNVKAIYQRYMGWFDGNPAHLWAHPPVAAGERYVAAMGGADAVVTKAAEAFGTGDFRWAAELLNHVVFAEPNHDKATALLADTYEQLGYGSENGPWRCFYLSGAHELRHGSFGTPIHTASADVVGSLSPAQIFDLLAVRLDATRCWDEMLNVDIRFEGSDLTWRLSLCNGVLTHSTSRQQALASATFTIDAPSRLIALLMGAPAAPESLAGSGVFAEGDAGVLERLLGFMEAPDPSFAIVTPE